MSSMQAFYDPFNAISLRPSQLMDQRFGVVLDSVDFATPLIYPFNAITLGRGPSNYYRAWRPKTAKSDYGSTLIASKEQFQVTLDVQQFSPNEITVKVGGNNTITVEGKHDEKQDQHGVVSRQFTRKYILPEGHDVDNLISTLSSDGVLTIIAPRFDDSIDEHRSIPILQTGVAHNATPTAAKPKPVEDKEEEQAEEKAE